MFSRRPNLISRSAGPMIPFAARKPRPLLGLSQVLLPVEAELRRLRRQVRQHELNELLPGAGLKRHVNARLDPDGGVRFPTHVPAASRAGKVGRVHLDSIRKIQQLLE